MNAVVRQQKLLNLYNKQGKKAILINGHGHTVGPIKNVPPNVAILFLAESGKCMDIETSLGIQNKFFTSRKKFLNFLTGGRGPKQNKHYHHVTDILAKTSLEGNTYLNMNIHLTPNKNFKTMGYVKKIPTRPTREQVKLKHLASTNFNKGTHRLSNIITKLGNGIYVVSACRSIPEEESNRFLLNIAPKEFPTTARKRLPRGTPISSAIIAQPTHSARKGVKSGEMLSPVGKFTRNKGNNIGNYKKAQEIRSKLLQGTGTRGNTPASLSRFAPGLLNHLKKVSSTNSSMKLRSGLVPKELKKKKTK
jgi:hypothetical protein